MRVAVDVRSLMDRPTGIGAYTAQLLRHLRQRADLALFSFGGERPSPALAALLDERERAVTFVHHPLPMRVMRRLWRSRIAGPVESFVGDVDWVLAASTTVPVARAPLVSVVHDALWADHPEWFNRYVQRAGPENLADAAGAAALVVTISERSRRAILALQPSLSERTVIVYPATEGAPPARAGADDGSVFFVGTLEPRKGAGVAARAMLLARGAASRARLVVAGGAGWGRPEGFDALATLEAAGRCEILGYAPAREIERRRARCAVAIVPFLDEGFGLPLLDALHAGAPAAASDIDVFRELAGDAFAGARAGDAADFADVLDALLGDPRRRAELSELGRARAARFSPERQAREVDVMIERVSSAAYSWRGRRV